MAVDDIVGIRVVGQYQGQNIVQVMHYKILAQTDDDHTVLTTLAVQWLADFDTAWLTVHSDQYFLIGVRTFSLTGANKKPGIVSDGSAGAVVGDETPSPVCRTITLYTDSDNFRRRGRLMFSGSVNAMFNVGDGAVTAAQIAALESLGASLIQQVTSAGNEFQPGLAPSGVLPFEPITAQKARKTPSVIRSRRVRGFLIG